MLRCHDSENAEELHNEVGVCAQVHETDESAMGFVRISWWVWVRFSRASSPTAHARTPLRRCLCILPGRRKWGTSPSHASFGAIFWRAGGPPSVRYELDLHGVTVDQKYACSEEQSLHGWLTIACSLSHHSFERNSHIGSHRWAISPSLFTGTRSRDNRAPKSFHIRQKLHY